jgi:Domain of unknown function (DUF4260)
MPSDDAPAVAGTPRLLLRLEGAALVLVAAALYWRLGESWWMFAILILAPDLSLLAYFGGPRFGAIVYNALHATVGPFVLALAGMVLPWELAIALTLIWLAHIGADRALGYGLKYASGFGFTHLGRIGSAGRA